MQEPDLKYWLALTRVPQFGAVRIGKLARAFPTMERVFSASVADLLEAGLDAKLANIFLQTKIQLDPDQELEKLEKAGVHAITRQHPSYPKRLLQIFDPPAVLFYRGTLPEPEKKHLAVVGSRHPSPYGMRAVEAIIAPLAREGVIIMSGLAYGIDAHAHDVTLQQKGITIAVLGCGVDAASIYPSGNRALSSRILASGGLLVSEFPIGTLPLKGHFPLRNRIIAGWSEGTIVIEAALKSGSLITARAALDNGRDVYAVPGAIDNPLSEGPNNLIKMGATAVTCAEDFMTISPSPDVIYSYEPRSEPERLLLALFLQSPLHIDELNTKIDLPIQTINSTITLLEMKGVLRHEGGRYYTRQK